MILIIKRLYKLFVLLISLKSDTQIIKRLSYLNFLMFSSTLQSWTNRPKVFERNVFESLISTSSLVASLEAHIQLNIIKFDLKPQKENSKNGKNFQTSEFIFIHVPSFLLSILLLFSFEEYELTNYRHWILCIYLTHFLRLQHLGLENL